MRDRSYITDDLIVLKYWFDQNVFRDVVVRTVRVIHNNYIAWVEIIYTDLM